MMAPLNNPRRGVLLLVVLSLLVLFVLIGVTFIITTGQFRRAASNSVRVERSGDAPANLTQMAALQLLRGTRDARSALYGHSLLNDMYGQDGMRARVITATQLTSSSGKLVELLTIKAASNYEPIEPRSQTSAFTTFTATQNDLIEGYFNGGVLTMISGQGAGRSTRVLRYLAASKEFLVMTFPGEIGFVPSADDAFVVNGPAFNGVGAGLDNTLQAMNRQVTVGSGNYPLSFLPNLSAFDSAAIPNTVRDIARLGGMDESYDIADYQNMFLGWVPADKTLQSTLLIPSFHRPALVNYFQNGGGGTLPFDSSNRDFWRTVIFRPTTLDHPQFTGSNRNPNNHALGFDPINGPWDVDNDGNGIEDSVWVDLGLPPQQALDGRMYKPLFAILCVDLDGRLNLNAHGSRAQVEGPVPFDTTTSPFPSPQFMAGSNASSQFPLLRGEGFGPADVSSARVHDERHGTQYDRQDE